MDDNRYDQDGRPVINYKYANYQTLGADGIVDPSTILERNDCLVGCSFDIISTISCGRFECSTLSIVLIIHRLVVMSRVFIDGWLN